MVTIGRRPIAEGDMLREDRHLPGTPPPRRVPSTEQASAVSAGRFQGAMAIVRPEAGLVERAQAGDTRAFDVLVGQEINRLYGIARAILGNDADAGDATQDAFLQAWRQLPRLREPERFDSWLRAILVNSCRQALRGRRRRLVRELAVGDPSEEIATCADPEDPPDDRAAAVDSLERAFGRLPVADRSILVMHHLEQLPLTEIAAALAIPVGTAKSRLFAARRQLERALEAER
jgi:RNA polymerase sigma-70 factor (ECF subfamily)